MNVFWGILIVFILVFLVILIAQNVELSSVFTGSLGENSIFEQGLKRPSGSSSFNLSEGTFLATSSPFIISRSTFEISRSPFSVFTLRQEQISSGTLLGFSPYSGRIRLSLGGSTASDPKQEYVMINYSGGSSQGVVSLDGWSVENKLGGRYSIPQASTLPIGAGIDPIEPVRLPPGGSVIVSTGFSPRDQNFQLNKCTGYFNEVYSFFPSLPASCPRPDTGAVRYTFKDTCVSFIQSLPTCLNQTNRVGQFPLAVKLDSQCVSWIVDHFSYSACLSEHKLDPDFLTGQWRVWLNQKDQIWSNVADRITLRDAQGRIVDQVQY